ncbi:hypothetical protein M0R45_020416 [Rubus argutus]|uniref:F-box domain-containing protein n=1 Tax=Rubus argutus TaxID=59490 RepID=A0AAW1XA16_RUBAR
MDQRRWENLDKDYLVKVFENVDMESLLLDVPFVCKSWHKVTLNPSCWKRLIFPEFEPEPPFYEFDYPIYDRFVSEFGLDSNRVSETAFIKFVVNRSQGNAVFLKLPGCSTIEAFEYVADACPSLVILGLPRCLLWKDINFDLIGKFKYLYMLSLGSCDKLDKILAVVSKHCKFFSHLTLSNAQIGKEEAMAITYLVPDIKILCLNRAQIDRDNLIILLKGCKDLMMLHAQNCIGFDEGDDEIAKLASHIAYFSCEGSKERFEFPFDFTQFDSYLTEDRFRELATMAAEVDEKEEADGEGELDGEEYSEL